MTSHRSSSSQAGMGRSLLDRPALRATAGEAVDTVRAGGKLVIVEEGGDHGALVIAAEHVDPAAIAFMATHCRGLVTLCLSPDRCAALGLRPMAPDGDGLSASQMMVSIEARERISTGISAHDRARTIAVAIDPASSPADLVEPGHVVPLRTAARGVLECADHPAAGVDLARLAGLGPAAVACSILDASGAVAGSEELAAFCRRHRVDMLETHELVAYRRTREPIVERIAVERLGTAVGALWSVFFRDYESGERHVALCHGDLERAEEVAVTVHAACLSGDVLGSGACDCGERLQQALERVAASPAGVLVYLGRERPCGTAASPLDSSGAVPAILRDLRVRQASMFSGERRHPARHRG